jgi:hypothetical protein
MSKGRPAQESAEKSRTKQDVQRDLKNYFQYKVEEKERYENYDKGISYPEKPSDRAIELMKQGKRVDFV